MSLPDYKAVAAANDVSEEELLKLVAGRVCATYPDECLFVLRGRGGKLQVRDVSKRSQVEKMQRARKPKKS